MKNRVEMFEQAASEVKADIEKLNKCKQLLRSMRATSPNPIIEVIDEMIENQLYHVKDLDESIQYEKSIA